MTGNRDVHPPGDGAAAQTTAEAPATARDGEQFFGAAKVVASMTAMSRILGLVREMAISALGATAAMDAFRVAFSVPNLFRRLFGEGATSASFVPIFTEVSEQQGWARAREVLGNSLGWLALVLLAITAVLEAALGLWLLLARPEPTDALLAILTMVMLPFMVTICLLAMLSAALNCRGHFAYPAFAPLILNAFQIAAAMLVYFYGLGDSRPALLLLSTSVVVAGVLQLLGAVLLLRRFDLSTRPTLRPLLPEVRRIAVMAGAMLLPMGAMQFSALFDRLWAYWMTAQPGETTFSLLGWTFSKPLAPGVVTWFDNANRLYQLPLGVLAVSLATAVFPLFARCASANDTDGLRQAANKALRLSFFMGIPSGVALVLLARPIMIVLFRRGDYTLADAEASALILQMYALGMWAYFGNQILLRAFYAQKDVRTPLRLAASLTGLNVLLVVVLLFTPLRHGGLGLATAITSTLNLLLLTWVLRRRWGRLGLRRLLRSLARTLGATAAMAGAILAVARATGRWAPQIGEMRQSVLITLAGTVLGLLAFAAAAWLLRCSELGELLARRQARQS